MSANEFIEKQKELLKKHNEEFNRSKIRNRMRHERIKNTLDKKICEFETNKKKRSDDFNLIRNKQL